VGRGRVLFSCNVKRAGDMGWVGKAPSVCSGLWEVVAMRMVAGLAAGKGTVLTV
jgi:hypothetical protein